MNDVKKSLGLAITSVYFTGCMSMSSLQTARALKPGVGELSIGGGYFSSPSVDKELDEEIKLPYLEISYRRGFFDKFDAGLKYTLPGSLTLDGKYQLIDANDFAVALGGGIGYLSIKSESGSLKSESSIYDLTIPLHTSYHPSNGAALYVTPKYVFRMASNKRSGSDIESENTTEKQNSSLVGGTIGTKLGSDWGVYLEVSYLKSLASNGGNLMQVGGSLFF